MKGRKTFLGPVVFLMRREQLLLVFILHQVPMQAFPKEMYTVKRHTGHSNLGGGIYFPTMEQAIMPGSDI